MLFLALGGLFFALVAARQQNQSLNAENHAGNNDVGGMLCLEVFPRFLVLCHVLLLVLARGVGKAQVVRLNRE